MSGYIGTQPVPQATQTRDSFTATSGQTSFATGGYTPNFLDVYLNGVKLASADYTATNGSDVVLASGASTGDILEVVAYTAFDTANVTGATNFTVTGAFTSQGIDDNGNATAITIDSSENVLVGLTATEAVGTNAGTQLRADGLVYAAVTSDAHILSRRSSDGAILNFRKDTTTVGSIGVNSNRLQIQSGSGGDLILGTGSNADAYRLSDAVFYPSVGDATADLGLSNRRFKDLYLSGGVYLGGTGSANKLEDYEEGTWTPNPTFGNQTTGMAFTTRTGGYTKVGRVVYISGRIVFSNKGSATGVFKIEGLPFTASNLGEGFYGGVTLHYVGNLANQTSWEVTQYPVIDTNSSYIYMRYANSSGGSNAHYHSDINNNSDLLFQGFYTTNA